MLDKWIFAGVSGTAVLASALIATAAQAQEWKGAGPVIAAFYNEEMSVPKGWELTFTGSQSGVEVYTFYVRPDTVDVDTSWIDAQGQLERALCEDDTLRGWVMSGMKARADKIVISKGKQTKTVGTGYVTCR
ncbi:hypothetical protein [Citromicrobium bathyomarinum]|uniref:hypothetical protein n=1 Tax=Citromicrobium bathyomarinum TaxID=72174 RepID=UPI00315A2591